MVTPLGTQAGALEVEVWADNWLSALRAGRKELGEDGGVPQGASCAMSESGVVTILDARNRRRFVLEPNPSALAPATDVAAAATPDAVPVATAQAASIETAGPTGAQATPVADARPEQPRASTAPAAEPGSAQPPSVIATRAEEPRPSTPPTPAHTSTAVPSPAAGEPVRRDPRAPLGTTAAVPATPSKTIPARAASAPALPPVGLAAMRAAGLMQPGELPPPGKAAGAADGDKPLASANESPALLRVDESRAAPSKPDGEPVVVTAAAAGPTSPAQQPPAEPAPLTPAGEAPHGADEPEQEPRAAAAVLAPSESTAPASDAPSPAASATADHAPPAQSEAPPSEDRSSPRARQTRAYSAQRAEALRREFETSRVLAGASPTPLANVGSARFDALAEAGKGLPRPSLRAVPPVSASGASAAPENNATPAESASTSAVEKTAARGASEGPPARVTVPRVTHPQGLVLLVSRDAEPSTESPLTYRERSYWVAPSSDHARLEALLQAEFIALRSELLAQPRGQLIHLAAFDHVFEEHPTRPPLATLEWKDWRGTAVFSVTVEPEEGEERSAVLERPPAPRAPESEWPLPSASRQRDRSSPARGGATHLDQPHKQPSVSPPSTWPVPASGRAPQPRRSVPPTREPALPVPGSSSWPLPPSVERATRARSEWPPVTPTVPGAVPPGSDWPHAPAARGPRADEPTPGTQGAGAKPTAAGSEWPLPPRAPSAAASPGSAWPPVANAGSLGGWPAASASAPSPAHDPFPAATSTREPTGEVDHRLATAFEAMPELYFLSTPVSGLEFTIELITSLVPCEAVSACLYDINTDEFRFVALSGTGAAARRASAVPSQAGLFGVAKRAPGEALVVANAANDTRFDSRIDGREELAVRSLLYLPVRFGGQLLGMLQLINRNKETGFTPADVAVLAYVSTQLAEFLLSRRSLMG